MIRDTPVDVLLSIDVEEDNWVSARDGISVENVREIPAFATFLERFRLRPTYFVNYQVAVRPWAVEILREATAVGRGEIGAHLHPWNTPPAERERVPGDTMLCNYGADQQAAKIETVTRALGEAFGAMPTTFRAGRFGLGPETVSALIAHGYRTDSSVTPYMSWVRYDNGPNFQGAPLHPYSLIGGGDVRRPVARGPLAEVPVSCGLSLSAVQQWNRLTRLLHSPPVRALRIPSVLGRSGLLRRFVLSPETTSARDMLAAARRILAADVPLIHIFMHATSLRPGLSPFARSRSDVFRLYDRIAAFVEGLAGTAALRFRTVGEVGAEVLASKNGAVPALPAGWRPLVVPPTLRRRSLRLLVVTPDWATLGETSRVSWRDIAHQLTRGGWEVHVAALDMNGDELADGVLVHGVRWLGGRAVRRATARVRDLVGRFDPDVIVTSGPPDVVHVVGHRARGSRPVAHVLDLSAPWWATADRPGREERFEAMLATWLEESDRGGCVEIITGSEMLAREIRRRIPGAGAVAPVLESRDPCGRLDEILRGATR